ncbi:MAG: hypothetical protein ABI678_05450 [Kofleriaceae bacterium]
MTPVVRKLALITHVVASVGWLGSVAAFLALSIAGLIGKDPQRVRAAYLAMEMIGWFVIVPLSVASLVTGLIQSLGTEWGLFRHYWILIKLVLNVLASAVLLLHMMPIGHVADIAATSVLGSDLHGIRVQLIADATAAIVVLLVATGLSIIKPRGLTKYGRKRRTT